MRGIAMSSRRRRVWQVSAGGVVYRRRNGRLDVLLCGRSADGVWGLPKGAPEPGESIEEAARREVAEETGIQVDIEAKIGTIEYWFRLPTRELCHKVVHHYLMVPVGGDVSLRDQEYDQVKWFELEEARRTLTYANEADLLAQAAAILQQEKG